MKYSIESAIEYSKRNELDKWLQEFLRDGSYEHSNPNIPLADGLLLEERFYVGPYLIDFDKITPMRIDEHLTGNELDYYLEKENEIIDQSAAAGSSIAKGETITLYIPYLPKEYPVWFSLSLHLFVRILV